MAEHKRYASLDGLRGLCALVVLAYHALLVLPAMSIPTDGSAVQTAASSTTWSVVWWLYRTPLRALWAGPEAVLIFFVLSGFVLTLPLGATGRFGWPAYCAGRVVRLYLPVWGAVVGSILLASAVVRSNTFGSVWLRGHQGPGPRSLAQDAVLLFGTSTVDGPLWSLRWEVWFSLMLPAGYVALRRCARSRWWLPTIGALAAVSSWGATDTRVRSISAVNYLTSGLLQYLPVFGIGMVLALNVVRVRALATGRPRKPGRVALAGVAGVVLLVSPSFPSPVGAGFWAPTTTFLSLVGATLVVVSSLCARPVVTFLNSAALRWAGSRSFSIYLVHEPVIVAAALLVRASTPWPWLGIAVLAAAAALMSAELFHRGVERPAHRLARRVSAIVDRRQELRLR